MTVDFTQPLVLLLLLVLPAFWLVDRISRTHLPRQRRRLVLGVRIAVAALLILGLAGPRIIGRADEQAGAVLAEPQHPVVPDEVHGGSPVGADEPLVVAVGGCVPPGVGLVVDVDGGRAAMLGRRHRRCLRRDPNCREPAERSGRGRRRRCGRSGDRRRGRSVFARSAPQSVHQPHARGP